MGIIAIKTERTQIYFLSDVLVAVASLDLKVPIIQRGRLGLRHNLHCRHMFWASKSCLLMFVMLWVLPLILGRLSNEAAAAIRKRHFLNSEFALLQPSSRLFHLIQFVKCWLFFLELNSQRLYRRSRKEKESKSSPCVHVLRKT